MSARLVVTTALLSVVVAAAAAAQPATVGERLSFEDATRLTWRTETRARGVAALVALLAESPDHVDARFELGRVLTWDLATRADGTAMLRSVAAAARERADISEALADVLAWDDATRPEAIARLRALVEGEPARASARLKLADVLSWDPATREESRTLYRRLLQEDARSIDAAVGLARVLSWSGRRSESRALYEGMLARDPSDQTALVGVAELDAWSGRARASLAALARYPAGTIETPDAVRLRAQAYSRIGRPARALAEYDRLLAVEPGNRAAQQSARELRRRLRPVLEIGADASDESGDAANRVETSSVPLRFSFHPAGSDAEISVTTAVARYRNAVGSSRDSSFGAGIDLPLGNRIRLNGDVQAHEFDRAARAYTGRGELQVAVHDALDLRVGGAREQLSSSRLSLGGEPVGGVFYGPSFVEQIFAGASVRPGGGFDVWALGSAGRIRGANIAANDREEVFAGFGRSFHPGALALRPGYSVAWMTYERDLSAFPSTDGAGDGVTAPGIGGYFSPFRFLNQMVRLDATLPAGRVVIVGGAGIGQQQVEEAWSRDFSRRVASSDAYLGIRVNASERISVGGRVTYQDVASAFDRTVVRATVAYGF